MTDTKGMACDYDAGLVNDYGGGNVDWWWDYMRAEIGRCNDYHRADVTRQRDEARAEGFAAGLEAAIKLCDGIAGNTADFSRDHRRAAGQCGAAIRALTEGAKP